MNEPPTRSYWCFLSYRHADNQEMGRQWATWLHQKIETYEVPSDLVGTSNGRGDAIPERIFPVFRDEEELPADANLSDPIEGALGGSKFLVVLCSPNAVASPYVATEILRFKQLGKSDRILAAMIAGEPNASRDSTKSGQECFPKPLQHPILESGELDEDHLAEPIASDFRLADGAEGWTTPEAYRQSLQSQGGKSRAEIENLVAAYQKKCELAFLKIVAGILGIPLGVLTKRDQAFQLAKAKRRSRILTAVATVMGLLALVAIGAGVNAYQSQRKAEAARDRESVQKKIAEGESSRALAALSRVSYQTGRRLNSGLNPNIALPHLASALESNPRNRAAAATFLENMVWVPRFLPSELLREEGEGECRLLKISPSRSLLAAAVDGEVFIYRLGDSPELLTTIANEGEPVELSWSLDEKVLMVRSGVPVERDPDLIFDQDDAVSGWLRRYDLDGALISEIESRTGFLSAMTLEGGNFLTRSGRMENQRLEYYDAAGKSPWQMDVGFALAMQVRAEDQTLLVYVAPDRLLELDISNGRLKRDRQLPGLAKVSPGIADSGSIPDGYAEFSPKGDRLLVASRSNLGTISDGTSQGVFGSIFLVDTMNGELLLKPEMELPFAEDWEVGSLLQRGEEGGWNSDESDDSPREGLYCEEVKFSDDGKSLVLALNVGASMRLEPGKDGGWIFFPPSNHENEDGIKLRTLGSNFQSVGFLNEGSKSYSFCRTNVASGVSSPVPPYVQFWEKGREGETREFALRLQDEDRIVAIERGQDADHFVTAHASGAIVLHRLMTRDPGFAEPIVPRSFDLPVLIEKGKGEGRMMEVESGKDLGTIPLPAGFEVFVVSAKSGIAILEPQSDSGQLLLVATDGRKPVELPMGQIYWHQDRMALSQDGRLLWSVSEEDEHQRLLTYSTLDGKEAAPPVDAVKVSVIQGVDLVHVQTAGEKEGQFFHELRHLISGEVREKWISSEDGITRSFLGSGSRAFYYEGQLEGLPWKFKFAVMDGGTGHARSAWTTVAERFDGGEANEYVFHVGREGTRVVVCGGSGRYNQGGLITYSTDEGRNLYPMKETFFDWQKRGRQIWESREGGLLWFEDYGNFIDPVTGQGCGAPDIGGGMKSATLARRILFADPPIETVDVARFSQAVSGMTFENGFPIRAPWKERLKAIEVMRTYAPGF